MLRLLHRFRCASPTFSDFLRLSWNGIHCLDSINSISGRDFSMEALLLLEELHAEIRCPLPFTQILQPRNPLEPQRDSAADSAALRVEPSPATTPHNGGLVP